MWRWGKGQEVFESETLSQLFKKLTMEIKALSEKFQQFTRENMKQNGENKSGNKYWNLMNVMKSAQINTQHTRKL